MGRKMQIATTKAQTLPGGLETIEEYDESDEDEDDIQREKPSPTL